MKIIDIFRISGNSLKEKKFRFTLNILGILIGCAAITGLISITQGLSEEVSGQLELFGPTNIMVIPGEFQFGRGYLGGSFNWRDLEMLEKIGSVRYISPIVGNFFCTHSKGGKSYYSDVYGADVEYFTIFQSFEVVKGRPLTRSDGAAAILGASVAHPEDSEGPVYRVGDRIKLNVKVKGLEKVMVFRVVGILKKVGGTFGSSDDNSIIIPFRVCQKLFETQNEISFIALKVDAVEAVNSVVEVIKERLGEGIMIMTSETAQEMIEEVLGTIESVLGGIAAISLFVAGVGIINTMMISVMERTREIGILKSIGAKNKEVLLIIIFEAAITGLVGGMLGAVTGFGLGNVIGDFINLPTSSSPSLGLMVVLFAILTSVIAGLYPAFKASSLNPVEALRYE